MAGAQARRHTSSMMKLITSKDPYLHALNVQNQLAELIQHLEFDINLVDEPRFQVLAETSREVLKSLYKAFNDYQEGTGKAWGGPGPMAREVKRHR